MTQLKSHKSINSLLIGFTEPTIHIINYVKVTIRKNYVKVNYNCKKGEQRKGYVIVPINDF